MATIINTPAQNGGNGMGFLLGIIVLIAFVVGLIYFGWPMINQATTSPTINVPDEIDVNVNQPEG